MMKSGMEMKVEMNGPQQPPHTMIKIVSFGELEAQIACAGLGLGCEMGGFLKVLNLEFLGLKVKIQNIWDGFISRSASVSA